MNIALYSARWRERERFFPNYSIYISALAQEPYCSLPCLKRGSPNIDQAVTMSFTKVCVRACVRVCVFLCVCVCVCGYIRAIKKLYIIPNLAFTVQKKWFKTPAFHFISLLAQTKRTNSRISILWDKM